MATFYEPQNLAIIRERLRKSSSTLVFEMDRVTDVELEIVAKYLSEQAGAYKVTNNFREIIITAGDSFQLVIDRRTQSISFGKGVTGTKSKNFLHDCWDFKQVGFEPTYHCDNDGYITGVLHQEPAFTCSLFSSGRKSVTFHTDNLEAGLDEAHECMKKYAKMIKEKQHIDSKVQVNYISPNNFDVGQQMCVSHRNGYIDFTNKDMVNALLQLKPKKGDVYYIGEIKKDMELHTLDTIELGCSKYNFLSNEFCSPCAHYSFKNNKIVAETMAESNDFCKGKVFKLNHYYIVVVNGTSRKEYQFNKADGKLICISSVTRQDWKIKYSIQIVDANNIIISGPYKESVDISDIETAFGKPLPEYKFEYL